MGKSTSRQPGSHPDPPEYWTTKDADNAVKRVKEATEAAGIKLPSVDRQYYTLDCPLVELGRVTPKTAFKLADSLDELGQALGELLALRDEVEVLRKEKGSDG
uniref:Uncharacterized protein n=1 Tax=Streptomyces sp. NBC_01393 TaxID=2903851 RepID=A0AAU3I5Z2_9ACTN